MKWCLSNMSDVTSEPDLSFSVDFARRYVAPSSTPTTRRCRRVLIPDAPQFVEAVNEVLALLTNADVWQAEAGTLTAQECAILMATMWNEYRKDQLCMLGVIVPIATADIPDGMLLCDGSIYAKDDYLDLFAVINPNLILSATTFKTPDLRGRFIMAAGEGDHPEYSIGGEYVHYLTQSELAFHQHTTNPHTHGYTLTTAVPTAAGEILGGADITTAIPSLTGDSGYLTDNGAGGDQPHNTTPPYFVLRYALVAR